MGKIVVRTVPAGVQFFLHAVNGGVIAASDAYLTERECLEGIAALQREAQQAGVEDQTTTEAPSQPLPRFEIFRDTAGLFYFRLRGTNGKLIMQSGSYKAKASCKNGIASVRKNAPDAQVVQ